MMVRSGIAPRALAVAVDLPLVPLLLDNYAASGILTDSFAADPYRPGTSGFVPAEGAAAMAIDSISTSERKKSGVNNCVSVVTVIGRK